MELCSFVDLHLGGGRGEEVCVYVCESVCVSHGVVGVWRLPMGMGRAAGWVLSPLPVPSRAVLQPVQAASASIGQRCRGPPQYDE